jgi:hypothetical protein
VMGSNGKLVSARLEIVLISMQDRCTVCTERTIGSEIVFGVEHLGDMGQVEARFGLFEDSVNLRAR